MKSIKNFINEALKINSNSKVILNKKIKPKDSEELREIIFNRIKEASNNETYILDCTDYKKLWTNYPYLCLIQLLLAYHS